MVCHPLRLLLLSGCVAIISCADPDARESAPLSVNALLRDDQSSGFTKALEPVPFDFPADHGAHPSYRLEWWYITGNLDSADGRRFGFQFTLFRNALDAQPVSSPSRWATNQVYLAHLALTDADQNRFYNDERYSRGALGLAGIDAFPFRAWLEDWRIDAAGNNVCDACFETRLSAKSHSFGLDLLLRNLKAPVLHGDAGLSRKSNTPGNASYYYSYSRLQTQGELSLEGRTYQVSGESWFDHEWSTSALEETQSGWDWFSIQLSDNTELMLFQLRHRDDPRQNYFYGTLIDSRGNAGQLSGKDFSIETTGTWSSPGSGATYPAGWKISIPAHDIELALTPLMAAQEMDQSFRYWEGAVDASGIRSGRPLSGRGYVELTGYD